MRTFRLTQAADQDFEQIFEYGIDQFGLEVALRYQNMLKDRFSRIVENPVLYPVSDLRPGYRRSVCGSHSVYYRLVDDDVVEIVRILGRQRIAMIIFNFCHEKTLNCPQKRFAQSSHFSYN